MIAAKNQIGSYWEATVSPVDDPALNGDHKADVAVVGAGFAGLSAAWKLAKLGLSVVVLEAEHAGFGASGRNGGFCCMGGSKLSEGDLIRRFGLDAARAFVSYQQAAIDTVAGRLKDWEFVADRHSDGEITLAHRPSEAADFFEEAAFLNKTFGLGVTVLSKEESAERGMAGPEFHGGLYVPRGFALNPLKYVLGLADAARQAGVVIHGTSPVRRITPEGAKWRLHCPSGSVLADKIILAGNGYSDERTTEWLSGRLLPALSNILVTRPLTDAELTDQGWTSDLMAADSRILLHYFRLLPDRRFLFGTRGGITETWPTPQRLRQRSRRDFARMFPAWAGVEETHFWAGRVCLSRDLLPFAGEVPDMPGVYAAMCWHGNGVAIASHTGEQLAEVVAGRKTLGDLPLVLRQPLRRFPFPVLRRLYLAGAYAWYGLKGGR